MDSTHSSEEEAGRALSGDVLLLTSFWFISET